MKKNSVDRTAIFSLAAIVMTIGTASIRAADQQVGSAAEQEACKRQAYSVMATVKNVRDASGTITVDLHDDNPEKFLKSGGKLLRLRVPATPGEMNICVPIEKPGIYALAAYQDRDGDHKLNKTWIGIPSEPYGVSNDAPMRLGPPKLKDAEFKVEQALTPVVITLRN